MNYDKNNPHAHEKDFHEMMDEICTYLLIGEIWQARAANQLRKNALRGFARWAESEAHGDAKTRMCLEKLLCDRLGYAPMLNIADAGKASNYMLGSAQELKKYMQIWHSQEEEFIKCLTEAVRAATVVDMEIYKELCCLLDEVQTEKMRIEICVKRLDLGQWNGHDVARVSKDLHSHFETNPHDRYINVNLG
jgi:hypothetical protein